MNKPIILIGGAPGTGKTSLAKDLVSKLDLDHQLGAGFIREIVRAETTPERDPELFGFVFAAADPIARLKAQAERLRPAIEACIRRARDEGTSLAIDGYCLIPEVYADLTVDLYLILDAGPRLDHHTRLHGKRHTIRSLSDA